MSYNSELQSNNLDLEAVLDAVNALPEAGIDTSDATATATDIASGKTAYVNGVKITGNVVTLNPGQTGISSPPANNTAFFDSSANTIGIQANPLINYLLRPNSVLKAAASASLFGDATADDVAKGKTFTSASGLKITGTYDGNTELPSGISKIASGLFIPSQNYTTNFAIEHNLGVKPNFFALILKEDVSSTPVANLLAYSVTIGKNAKYNNSSSIVYTTTYMYGGYNGTPQFSGSTSRNNNTTYLGSNSCYVICSSVYTVLSGYTYRWVCGVMNNIE